MVATSGAVAPDGDGAPSIGRPIAGVVADSLTSACSRSSLARRRAGAWRRGHRARLPEPPRAHCRTVHRRPEGRRYRTGDRVRVRADGEIEFLGRLDDQLSIRGFRVEPGEIAAALNSHPAIEASVAVGVVAPAPSGGSSPIWSRVTASGPTATNWPVSSAIRFPITWCPPSFVWLDQLPLTAHGKIDRERCRHRTTRRGGPAERPPVDTGRGGDGVRRSRAARYREIGLNENFFLLGGHSMLGAQLIVRLGTCSASRSA